MSRHSDTNHPICGDIFYPSDPDELKKLLDTMLDTASPSAVPGYPDGLHLPAAILAPHGAYLFSADAMAAAYSVVRQLKPRRLITAAPLHREVLRDDSESLVFYPDWKCMVSAAGGSIPIDRQAASSLEALSPAVKLQNLYFEEEIGIEVQLPFIHRLFPDIPILPLLAAAPTSRCARMIAEIAGLIDPFSSLWIVSSNLSGFLPVKEAVDQGSDVLQMLTEGGSRSLLEAYRRRKVGMCGVQIAAGLDRSGLFADRWILLADRLHFSGCADDTHRTAMAPLLLPAAADKKTE